MGRKVFVSYKYSDCNVQDLDIYEQGYFGRVKIQTTVRHYVDQLTNILDKTDNIYKGEDDGESLAGFSDNHIASKLRDKIFDSTITIVFVSRGMKNPFLLESQQWMPWEISYSLKEITRGERTSSSNGVLAVVLPDTLGSYDYFVRYDAVCNCTNYDTPFLFKILRDNMFNEKHPTTTPCVNGATVFHGDFSYIQAVRWDAFKLNPNSYLDKAIAIRDKSNEYFITKNIN